MTFVVIVLFSVAFLSATKISEADEALAQFGKGNQEFTSDVYAVSKIRNFFILREYYDKPIPIRKEESIKHVEV